ncbi:MAG: lytic transglycosylase domain-containing protein [Clostridia bacterium]|nr:lytic transglycosylase domain-containing protein [Clostridia bacterium]
MKRIIIFILAVALLFSLGIYAAYRVFPMQYADIIEKYADEYGLSKDLVSGVIYAESGFNEKAHSGLARGLMQLTDETAFWVAGKLGIEYEADMAENPEINIKMGCYYLSYLMQKYENTETALAAYNGGMGNVTRWLGDKNYSTDGKTLFKVPYAETEKYVKRVKLFTKIYSRLYN